MEIESWNRSSEVNELRLYWDLIFPIIGNWEFDTLNCFTTAGQFNLI